MFLRSSLRTKQTFLSRCLSTVDRKQMRISRVVARETEWSRRQAIVAIEEGKVRVDGVEVKDPGLLVEEGSTIQVGSMEIPVQSFASSISSARLFLAHKLPGEVVSWHDPEGRVTLFDRLQAMGVPSGLNSVGRLDLLSEGLLLLTDDGAVKRYLEHPGNRIQRVYRARVQGDIEPWMIDALRRGLLLPRKSGGRRREWWKSRQGSGRSGRRRERGSDSDEEQLRPMSVVVQSSRGKTHWLRIVLDEGRNREIRRAMDHLGLRCDRLIRTQYGPYHLKQAGPRGAVTEAKLTKDIIYAATQFLDERQE